MTRHSPTADVVSGGRVIAFVTGLAIVALIGILRPADAFVLHVLIIGLTWSVITLTWDLLLGYAGVMSYGQVGLFVVGAYVTGLVTVELGWSPWLGLPISALATCLLSVMVGVVALRLEAIYVALITFVLHLSLAPVLVLARELGTGGSSGILSIPSFSIAGQQLSLSDRAPWFWLALVIAAVSGTTVLIWLRSHIGLALAAARGNRPLAESLGIYTYKYRLLTWALSGTLVGVAGSFYGVYAGSISPRLLGLDTFLMTMTMLILGGPRQFPGSIFAAIIVTAASELLRPLGTLRLVIFGLALILVVLYAPRGVGGLLGSWAEIGRRLLQKTRSVRIPRDLG